MRTVNSFIVLTLIVAGAATFAGAQKRRTATAKSAPIIFAVTNEGQSLEPIGTVNKSELAPVAGGDSDLKTITAFNAEYYKPKAKYNLIFGGASDGTVTVVSSNAKSECGKNIASVTTTARRAKLKGVITALASSEMPGKKASGVRRLPSAAERAEIESLVRAEFIKQGVTADAAKTLKYHNLTAIDADSDGKPEMIGSFWVESSPKERNQLFFIADQGTNGKYKLGYTAYQKLTPDDVMSGELSALDTGVYNELLIDALDYDDSGTAKIFTVVEGFEGNTFHVYSRRDGKWTQNFETNNYHCAY